MKIILADDHTLFRDGFVLLLKQLEAGAEVITAGSLEDALGQVRAHPDADLLLLDLQMPGMQGLASVRAVMRDFPSLPVAILSASDSLAVMEAFLAAGAAGFIPKSSSAPVMLSALKLIMAGGVYLPPQLLVSGQVTAGEAAAKGGPLTPRQLDVLRLLCEGKSNKLICRELGLGEGTVKAHIAAIFRALSVSNRTEEALEAKRLGLL
jgi:DNA-binding NarL/FixJ family response regulator